MEQEAVLNEQEVLQQLQLSKYQGLAFHLSTVSVGVFAFFLLTEAAAIIDTQSLLNGVIAVLLIVVVISVLIWHQIIRRRESHLHRVLRIYFPIRYRFLKRWNGDYLARWLVISIISFVIIFALILDELYQLRFGDHVVLVQHQRAKANHQDTMLNSALGLFGIQIALFGFMLQQVLSRYSGMVAHSVVSHSAIYTLVFFPIFGVSCYWLFLLQGADQETMESVTFLVGFLLATGLLLSLLVARAGLSESGAMRYFGISAGRLITRCMPSPINNRTRVARYFWLPLNYLSLDFRNKERYQYINPPQAGVAKTTEALNVMLGVANKSLIDGQHDVFVASLSSIEMIIGRYADKRRHYISAEDTVFNYLNFQLAALVEAAAKAPNQYMVTNLADTIGRISTLIYCIGSLDGVSVDEQPDGGLERQSNNLLVSLWLGLLVQCFDETHDLTRSHAAHAAIDHMTILANVAITKGDSDAITLFYEESFNKIFAQCLLKMNDAYHASLAGKSLQKLLAVLLQISIHRAKQRGSHKDPFKSVLELLSNSSKLYLTVNKRPSLNLGDPVRVWTNVTARDDAAIQLIFYSIIVRAIDSTRTYRIALDDMRRILDANADLAEFCLQQDVYLTPDFFESFAEMAYLVIRGLPRKFFDYAEVEREERRFPALPDEVACPQEDNVKHIGELLRRLYQETFSSSRTFLDWQSSLFSILGMLVVRFADYREEYVREEVLFTAELILRLVRDTVQAGQRPPPEAEDYLQLLGAWIGGFGLGREVSDAVLSHCASRYTIRRVGTDGSRSRFGIHGYPTENYHDFSLLALSNLRVHDLLSSDELNEVGSWNSRLMDEGILMHFAERIWAQHHSLQ